MLKVKKKLPVCSKVDFWKPLKQMLLCGYPIMATLYQCKGAFYKENKSIPKNTF